MTHMSTSDSSTMPSKVAAIHLVLLVLVSATFVSAAAVPPPLFSSHGLSPRYPAAVDKVDDSPTAPSDAPQASDSNQQGLLESLNGLLGRPDAVDLWRRWLMGLLGDEDLTDDQASEAADQLPVISAPLGQSVVQASVGASAAISLSVAASASAGLTQILPSLSVATIAGSATPTISVAQSLSGPGVQLSTGVTLPTGSLSTPSLGTLATLATSSPSLSIDLSILSVSITESLSVPSSVGVDISVTQSLDISATVQLDSDALTASITSLPLPSPTVSTLEPEFHILPFPFPIETTAVQITDITGSLADVLETSVPLPGVSTPSPQITISDTLVVDSLAPTLSTPSVDTGVVPSIPTLSITSVTIPSPTLEAPSGVTAEISAPSLSISSVSIPGISTPTLSISSLPAAEASTPSISVPIPSGPPGLSIASLPSISATPTSVLGVTESLPQISVSSLSVSVSTSGVPVHFGFPLQSISTTLPVVEPTSLVAVPSNSVELDVTIGLSSDLALSTPSPLSASLEAPVPTSVDTSVPIDQLLSQSSMITFTKYLPGSAPTTTPSISDLLSLSAALATTVSIPSEVAPSLTIPTPSISVASLPTDVSEIVALLPTDVASLPSGIVIEIPTPGLTTSLPTEASLGTGLLGTSLDIASALDTSVIPSSPSLDVSPTLTSVSLPTDVSQTLVLPTSLTESISLSLISEISASIIPPTASVSLPEVSLESTLSVSLTAPPASALPTAATVNTILLEATFPLEVPSNALTAIPGLPSSLIQASSISLSASNPIGTVAVGFSETPSISATILEVVSVSEVVPSLVLETSAIVSPVTVSGTVVGPVSATASFSLQASIGAELPSTVLSSTPVLSVSTDVIPSLTISGLGAGLSITSVAIATGTPSIIDTVSPSIPAITLAPPALPSITESVSTFFSQPNIASSDLPPVPLPSLSISPGEHYDALTPLRQLCQDNSQGTVSLPLLDRFYGPNAYPSLHPFPGCEPPAQNSSQALRAPGLLNCTGLGQEVQACQSLGHKVLLTVRASNVSDVDGNTHYGDSGNTTSPSGPHFGSSGVEGSNSTGSPTFPFDSPIHPNLFDSSHPASSFALTLFSLFSAGHTERADLRPLGPDAPGSSSPDGTTWWSKPLGDEVLVDGFDVQIPTEWQNTYQETQFDIFVDRLRELLDEDWQAGQGAEVSDAGAVGAGIVVEGWI